MVNAPLLAAVGALAQGATTSSGDDTGRTIALVIGALLGLALLLAVLTFWYWRRTDPRKAVPRSGRATPVGVQPAAPPPAPGGRAPAAGGPRGASSAGGPPTGSADDRGISAEEWVRLTGARQSPPRGRS